MTDCSDSFRFSYRQRLHGRNDFAAVYDYNVRKGVGPFVVYGRPNGFKYSRLGLSVSRKVGTAVRRGRVKRMLREAFRLDQHELPAGYDFVVVVRVHDDMKLAEYQRLLAQAASTVARKCQQRVDKAADEETDHVK